ncbi:hypothetical protein [Candidatus Accumulibacter sp. ACC012]|uniref:hypothetical protein n=1 Tax=Candidatus Accumulibacter sp. ACC012 TaxID=2823332 RepID=UPI0025BBE2DC|nr:hypothetical protein [Candidatus Accumulibacter sp. ACC012]
MQNVLDFFASAESEQTDLYAALANVRQAVQVAWFRSRPIWVRDLESEFGARCRWPRTAGLRRKSVRAAIRAFPRAKAARSKNRDFAAASETHPRQVRADFLGNDQATPVTEVGTFRCRSLHSNHKAGNLYMESRRTPLRQREVVADIPERDELKDAGRGYLRNVSLVNIWATAPFMHNNAIGPEICGKPANKANDFHRARYVDSAGLLLARQPDCLRYDPSVEGRFDLYKLSMFELLNPKERGSKRTLTNADLIIDVGIRPLDGKTEKPLFDFGQVKIPAGTSAGFLNGLMHKQLIGDLFLAKRHPDKLEAAGKASLLPTLQTIADEIIKNPSRFVEILREQRDFISANYQSCTEEIENQGHRFGEDLSEADKKALTAFLATL